MATELTVIVEQVLVEEEEEEEELKATELKVMSRWKISSVSRIRWYRWSEKA